MISGDDMILSIDPGNIESAYSIIDKNLKPVKFAKVQNEVFLEDLKLRRFSRDFDINHVAIEMIACYGMPVGKEVFDTCVWIGRFIEHMPDGAKIQYIYRKDEKLNLCNSPKAKDANIRQALIDRFAKHDLKNGKGTKKNPDWFYGFAADIWSAYAVGVTYHDMYLV